MLCKVLHLRENALAASHDAAPPPLALIADRAPSHVRHAR